MPVPLFFYRVLYRNCLSGPASWWTPVAPVGGRHFRDAAPVPAALAGT